MKKITKKGYDAIMAEIDERWNVERPIVVEEVYQAALLGDRSENAAYIYGKQRLRKIDSRIRYLKRKISNVKIIDTKTLPHRPDIQFGAWVTIINEEDTETLFQLVDERESDPNDDRISIQSPVGQSLIGNTEGESVEVKLPKGTQILDIIHVHYGTDPRENQS
jgi:transcription elongation factor GreB